MKKFCAGIGLIGIGAACCIAATALAPWSQDAVNDPVLGISCMFAAGVFTLAGIFSIGYTAMAEGHKILSELTCCPEKKRTGASRGRRNR